MQALRQDGEFILWRGRDDDGSAVLVLAPVAEHPAPASMARLEHEYALQADLDPAWAARPRRLDRQAGRPVLVLDDPGGEPLERRLGYRLELPDFLALALSLAAALGRVHAAGLIHKDLKPPNVLVDSTSGKTFLTGFGLASRLPREYQAPEPPDVIAGTLAYMAPEQTGRMNRPVDCRADLYALGVIFYQLLTGALPFSAADPMEWIHCHVARQPVPPAERVPGVPAAVSALVMKLLAKTADERYQTSTGLAADLRRCIEQWQAKRRIDVFPLARQDASDRLRIPEKLYGREAEIDVLLHSFARIAAGSGPELVLVSGYSGIGKSSLVNELHKALVLPRGLFAAGKFDQYRRDVPYTTLAQALQGLVRPLLAKDEAALGAWRAALAAALGASGALLASLVPELELIVGAQPAAPELPPREAENRFLAVLARFLGVFARPEHPLVIFLDDLQWLDAATHRVLSHLATHPELRHLLLIGAYRDNEVDAAHPVRLTLDAIRQAGAAMRDIVLGPLSVDDMRRLLADSLHCEPGQADPLARLVYQKTAGNPFFAIQFLAALQEEGLLRFDAEAAGWTWDLAGIEAKGYTDNVVDLMLGKLARLPAATRRVMQELAALGSAAETDLLALVHGDTKRRIEADLWEAIEAGFVLTGKGICRFVHDRVQEAAYALIPNEERPRLHLSIGRRLLSSWPHEQVEDRVFDVVGQLNRGAELIADPQEKTELCRLNALAGRRAKAAAAYAAAREHLARAAALLSPAAWDSDYAETFGLHLEWAECEHLAGDFAAGDALFEQLLTRARDRLDKARVHRLSSRLCLMAGRFDQGLRLIVDALGLYGFALPDSDAALLAAADQAMDSLRTRLAGETITHLTDLPKANDPEGQMLIGLLVEGLMPAYAARPPIFPLLSAKAVELSLHYGNCVDSCMAYYSYAVVLIAFRWELSPAFELSRQSLALIDQFDDPRPRGALLAGHGGLVLPWRRHIAEGIPFLERGLAALLEVGDYPLAGNCAMLPVWAVFEQGDSLARLLEASEKYAALARQMHNPVLQETVLLCRRLVASLEGETSPPESFDGEGFSTAECLERFRRTGWHAGIAYYNVMQQIAAYLYGRDREALAAADEARPVLGLMMAMPVAASNFFYRLLTLAALYPQATQEEQQAWTTELAEGLARLQFWADNCPANFAHRNALLAAEVARIEGRELDAERLYEAAIGAARENGFVHLEALANELAGKFYLARGFGRIAVAYLRDARSGFLRWGALGKARALESVYAELAEPEPRGPDATATNTIRAGLEQIDAATVVKASQAVSGEIVLARLVEMLLRIVLEHAGADRGLLLLPEAASFRVAARAATEHEQVVVALDPIAHSLADPPADLPESILHYVVRTRETVLLDDASAPQLFADDRYLVEQAPRSVLCLPLVKQARLAGILYLENRLTPRVFTRSRLAVLELLASQAAISLENAQLYTSLQDREARIRRLVEANIVGIVFFTIGGAISEANDAFLALVGYSRDDLHSGRVSWKDMTPPEYAAADAQALEQLLATGTCRPFEKEYQRRDGSRVPVLIAGAMLEGSQEQGIAFILDLSERRRADAERRAREAAEAANRAKSEFLANMSHELRSPLNTILGFARLLAREPSAETLRDDLGLIVKSGEHLHSLIDQVLDLSKLEAGRSTLNAAEFDLHTLLGDLQSLLTPKAVDKGVQLIFEREPGVPQRVRADPLKLRQVLINLIDNALKFTVRGSVIVRLAAKQLSGDAGCRLAFAVQDTGAGIAPEDLPQLFGAFVQTKAGLQAQQGSGLGLAISRGFVRLMGGELTAESKEGVGSTFSFAVPVDVLPPETAARAPARRVVGLAPGEPRYRVLVVDDRVEARLLIRRLLAPLGFAVEEAGDGLEAIAHWRQWQPDLIWMDLRMPVLDGLEATRRIRAESKSSRPVIIALTASAFEEERAEVLAAGCSDFLRKPFQERDLFALIEKHLGARFVFAEEGAPPSAPALDATALAALPQELRTALEQALIRLDTAAVEAVVASIMERNPPLGEALLALVGDFQYDEILSLIKPAGLKKELRLGSSPPSCR